MTTKAIPNRYKPEEIEAKWQKKWEEEGVYRPDIKNPKKPYYNLMMFPYPSAEGLHVGNMYAFTGVDVHGRYKRMQGYEVFEPIGLDGFGIHSENYALKVGRTPKEHAQVSEHNFYRQLASIGNSFDWSRTLETYDSDYYRWTQWLFAEMFKHGLAYRKKAEVNWCPGCKTVLADEQVINEKCERCSSMVEKKALEQWFFKITAHAERLLQNTYKPQFNWPEKVKIGQRNWIGKKTGIAIKYPLAIPTLRANEVSREDSIKEGSLRQWVDRTVNFIEVFTTRPDTNFGATFIVISPEHPQALELATDQYKKEVENYIKLSKSKSKEDRFAEGKKKTGAFTGSYATNQLTGEEMPIWIADFVLMDFGTGAVVGVPGHDKRDFEFAVAMGLPIKRVVVGKDGDTSEITKVEQVQEDEGKMINSGFLDGVDIKEAIEKMMLYIENNGWGKRVTTYHLRDWLISRQRYWGAPIPMIFCKACHSKGLSWFNNPVTKSEREILNIKFQISDSAVQTAGWYPVPEDQLPVLLPDVKEWKPTGTGKGPLAGVPEFYETTCPGCGGKADRETDVCDTFLDSSWYYLMYPFSVNPKSKIQNPKVHNSPESAKEGTSSSNQRFGGVGGVGEGLPWDIDTLAQWTPIDSYIGGAEHTVLHLLYTRFVWQALRDWGMFNVKEPINDEYDPDEPFKRFYAHGLIIKDGAKMSKSKGNVVVPDEYIKLYGSDTLRTYLMFLGAFDQGGDFRDSGIAGMYRYLTRVWRLVEMTAKKNSKKLDLDHQEGQKVLAKTIKRVTEDMDRLHYNTAIARMMEFTNWWTDHQEGVTNEMMADFLKLLAPFAPHMTEELYQSIKGEASSVKPNGFESIHFAPWPTFDPRLVEEKVVKVIVQINGKTRNLLEMTIESANQQSEVEQMAQKSAKISKWLEGKKIRHIVFVPGRLINFVI